MTRSDRWFLLSVYLITLAILIEPKTFFTGLLGLAGFLFLGVSAYFMRRDGK